MYSCLSPWLVKTVGRSPREPHIYPCLSPWLLADLHESICIQSLNMCYMYMYTILDQGYMYMYAILDQGYRCTSNPVRTIGLAAHIAITLHARLGILPVRSSCLKARLSIAGWTFSTQTRLHNQSRTVKNIGAISNNEAHRSNEHRLLLSREEHSHYQ
jgi:hypothetical protein